MEGNYFVDAHTHFVSFGLHLERPDLSKTKSLKEAISLLKKEVGKRGIIIGEDWDESRWEEKRFPAKEELDREFPDVPVIMRRICGHVAVANTRALELIPPGWKYVREDGVLLEDVVLNLNRIFPPSFDEIKRAILRAQEVALHLNVGEIHDILIPEYYRAYLELEKEGKLKIKVLGFVLDEFRDFEEPEGKFVKFGGWKIFLDGSIGARTAALEKFSYTDGGKGMLLHEDEELEELFKLARERGKVLMIHAIGDRAIEQVLRVGKGRVCGDRIEHFELARDEQIERAIEEGFILSMQPNFIGNWSHGGGLYEKNLGRDYRINNRIGLIYRKGGKILFGSDMMPFSPPYGIDSVVRAPFPEQRLSYREAYKIYTSSSFFSKNNQPS